MTRSEHMYLCEPYIEVSASSCDHKACIPLHLLTLYLYVYHQVPEGTSRPYCLCPALSVPHPTTHEPKSPISAHAGVISPCSSQLVGVRVSSPLSAPASQKDLGSSLQAAYLLDGPSDTNFLLSLAGVSDLPLFTA